MKYYFNKVIKRKFEEAINDVTEALKTEGFGIISSIDMQAKLKEKLGVDYKKYTILGACNPPYAYKSLQAEEKIGVMLPCNIVVIDKENGTTEIAAVNPQVSMMVIHNENIEPYANEISVKLQRVIDSL